jgi:predicted small integral membrane protein
VLIALAWNGIVSRSTALLGAVSLVVGYVITRSMNSIVRDVLYFGRRSGESRIINRAFTVHLWPEVIREIAGQFWYVSAATACLGLVGLVAMVRAVAKKARAYKRSDELSPERFAFVFILMTFAFLIVLGALQLALGKRADHYIYGRYVEMCVPALFAVACVTLERTKLLAERLWRWSIAFFAFLTAMYVLLVGADAVRRAISIDGPMRTANVLAIDALSHAVRRPGLLTMTPILCAVSIAIVYLYMRKKEMALVVLASLLLVSSAWTASSTLINRSSPDRGVGVALQSVSHSDSSRIAYDGLKPQDRNYYTLRYASHPSLIVWVDTRTEIRIPESFSCLYGYADRKPVDGEWEIVGREISIERVLWRRVGLSSC